MEATDLLIEARRVLAYSYVVGWFNLREDEKERELFMYLQEDLERNTDHLSGLYEKDVDTIEDYENFIIWKEEVSNFTRVNASFLDKFIEGTMGGLTN